MDSYQYKLKQPSFCLVSFSHVSEKISKFIFLGNSTPPKVFSLSIQIYIFLNGTSIQGLHIVLSKDNVSVERALYFQCYILRIFIVSFLQFSIFQVVKTLLETPLIYRYMCNMPNVLQVYFQALYYSRIQT